MKVLKWFSKSPDFALKAFLILFCSSFHENSNKKFWKGLKMVPKKSRFCPKGPNFASVASIQAKSQFLNPVSERLNYSWFCLSFCYLAGLLFGTSRNNVSRNLKIFINFLVNNVSFVSKRNQDFFNKKCRILTLCDKKVLCFSISLQNSVKHCWGMLKQCLL